MLNFFLIKYHLIWILSDHLCLDIYLLGKGYKERIYHIRSLGYTEFRDIKYFSDDFSGSAYKELQFPTLS